VSNTGLDIKAQSLHAGTALLPADKKRWMGIYLKGQKIGFTSSRFYPEIDGYSVYEEIRMRLMISGTPQDIHSTTRVSLSPEFKIRAFRFVMDAAQNIKIEGKIQNKILILDIETAGNKSRQKIQLDEIPQMPLTVIPYLLREGLKSGVRVKFPVFDPTTLSTQNMLVEVVGKEKILSNNKEVEAFKIKGNLNGIPLLMWIDEQGNELKEESPMGFTLIAEPMSEAMRLPVSSSELSDIITQTAIPFNIELPPDISYLKVRLRGIDFTGLELNGGRQSIKGDILEIVKEDINIPEYVPLPVSSMRQFLKESPFIQSKDPRIVNLAKEIIDGEKNSLIAGRILWAWVFKNIKKTPSITIPSAIDVLNTRKGDCNEHTALYTALARSIGLPTRISVGLVYKDRYFYYHAWPEIFAGRWIAVDPTLGQFPAGAAHIRLISGDLNKQMMLLKVINNISIEGIEYK
jgi:transglutaminase-like putative cysteine protease